MIIVETMTNGHFSTYFQGGEVSRVTGHQSIFFAKLGFVWIVLKLYA